MQIATDDKHSTPGAAPAPAAGAHDGITTRIALWSARNPWKAVLVWFLLIAVTFSLSMVATPRQATQAELMTGEARDAFRIADDAGYVAPAVESVLVRSAAGAGDPEAAQQAAVEIVDALGGLPGVAQATGPVPSDDGSALLVVAEMAGDPDTAQDRVEPLLDATAEVAAEHPGLTIEQVGPASIQQEFQEWLAEDVEKATVLSLPVTLVILLVAFGAIVMAGIPVVLALSSVASATGLWAVASQVFPDQGMVMHLIVLVGMAVGVDYSLFYLRRFREERHAGRTNIDSIGIAAQTAGHSVIISGAAVALSLAGLFLVQDAFFSGMAAGAILVVLVAMVSSLTVLPAMLAKLGRWVDTPRVPFVWRLSGGREPRVMPALLRPVIRHPRTALLGSLLVLLALAAPALGMSLKTTQVEDFPRSLETMQRYDALVEAFPGTSNTATVVVQVPAEETGSLADELGEVAALVAERPELYSGVGEPWASDDGRTVVVPVDVPFTADSPEARDAVETLRETIVPQTVATIPGVQHAVGGDIATDVDYTGNLLEKLPLVIGIVIALTFVFMFVVYRSLLVALVTVGLNLLSTAAAFGVLTLVFQNTWAEGLLGFESNGHVVSWVPILLFVVLSGLSLDYHVFVVSRIRENALSGMTVQRSVFDGVVRTAGVVTSAAVVMVAVFAIFGSLSFMELKQIGVGLSAAILLDATIIRIVTLPAVMVAAHRVLWWPGRVAAPSDEVDAPVTVASILGTGQDEVSGTSADDARLAQARSGSTL
ncbi:MMPL family transporter [Georgenia sp. Marseille-Q6866]